MSKRILKLFCAVMTVVLLWTAMCPALAASVKAKVSSSSARFYKTASTSSKNVSIKKGTHLTVTAVKNGWAKVKCKGVTGYMKTSALSKVKKTNTSWKSRVAKTNWFGGGSNILKKGQYGYIYDIKTGTSIRIKRMGGHNHADVEPATKADTAKLKRITGGYSWDSRAVILYANGKYVAAAINSKPHGTQTIKNNGYNGQFCLHLTGSLTHCSGKLNSEHQEAITRAYNWAH